MCRTVLTLKVGDRLEAKDYLRIPYSEFMMDKKNTLAICHGIVKACCIMLGEDCFFFMCLTVQRGAGRTGATELSLSQ